MIPLSPAERNVLELLANGCSSREVAEQLYYSPGTIRNLTREAVAKLHARNRTHAAALAVARGLVEVGEHAKN